MKRALLVVLVVLGFAGFYLTGHLDRTLYPVGLNFHECRRNAVGATFCGSELDEYRQKVLRPIQGASEDLNRLQRESRERQEREQAGREAEAGQP